LKALKETRKDGYPNGNEKDIKRKEEKKEVKLKVL
jgi:hypothetical protein